MLVSQVERKQLFPCSPGYMWFALICSFTLLSVHVISCMQLPVDDAISLQLSLKIPNMLFFPTVKLSFKLPQMQILLTKKVGQWSNQSEAVYWRSPTLYKYRICILCTFCFFLAKCRNPKSSERSIIKPRTIVCCSKYYQIIFIIKLRLHERRRSPVREKRTRSIWAET